MYVSKLLYIKLNDSLIEATQGKTRSDKARQTKQDGVLSRPANPDKLNTGQIALLKVKSGIISCFNDPE